MTWAMVWPCAGPGEQRLQDQQIERALEQIGIERRGRTARHVSKAIRFRRSVHKMI